MMDQFVVGAPSWILPAAILGGVLLLIVAWAYVRAPASRWTRLSAFALKVVALAAIAICLVEPLYSGRRPRPQANIMALLVDNSQSMQVGDALAAEERRERLAASIRESSPWRARLEQDFTVRTYAFDSRLFAAADYESLPFDGYASSLLQALDTIGSRYRNRPVAGLLLFSDGNATDSTAKVAAWESLGFPVYPVVDGGESKKQDLSVVAVSVNQSEFEAAPVTLQVDASCTGFTEAAGERIVAQLLSDKGDLVEEQFLPMPREGTPAHFRFRFRPDKSGVCFYRVAVFLESQRETYQRNDRGPEVTLANNSQLVTVQGRRGPYRVLYVCGRPNWEFKFLRRALAEDDEIHLAGLVRIARKQPRFTFRAAGSGGTNPLFEDFAEDEEETAEQYDEPVLLKFAIQDGELRGGFPKTADELFSYHAVVLDDIEADFFTQDQMLLLRRFVASRGGGLLLLGGPDSFSQGGYDRTPLGELAPVYVRATGEQKKPESFRVQLTREGLLEPWMRLRDTEGAEQARLQSMPDFRALSNVGHVKAGASVLATIDGPASADRPAFVVQRFGNGRSAALLVGDLWRWAMHRPEKGEQDLPQAWRQMIRWLVSDVPRRVELKVEQSEDPSQPVQFRIQVRDEEYLPLDNAVVELDVTSPSGKMFTLSAEPSPREAGLYETSYWPLEEGGYFAEAAVTAPDGSALPGAEGGWTAQPAAGEYRALEPNRELLERIARQTGGELVQLDEVDEFVASLQNRQVPVTETWVYPVWHQPWVLTIAVMCLCAEWGLRRWRGLP